ncbi:hypothetical protein WN944_004643 [Citrus x changshan-huyou]|uniref:Uncharacterized protein n=1 Tax=Citrus x changshan-huyou TaxID=2935761 RepID=A0AAP0M3H1_9ROSI
MGTREVYEEKLRSGNLHHDPTMNPGLGCPRCPRCLSLLDPNSEKGEWTITSVLHDATAVAGSGFGAMLGAVYGFNTGIPFLQNHLKGPKWLPFVTGIPLLLMFSGASAAFGGMNGAFILIFIFIRFPCEVHLKEEWQAGREPPGDGTELTRLSCHLEGEYQDSTLEEIGLNCFVKCESAGYALPKFTQLSVTSYYAASSASHYGISLLTRKIEEGHNSGTWQEKLR